MHEKIGPRQEQHRTNHNSCSFVLYVLDFSLYRLTWLTVWVFPLPACIPSQQIYQFLMYLNTFGPKMQLKNHPHNFNTMNIRSLAVLPNPSDTQVATLIVCSYHDNFLRFFFKTMFLCIAPWKDLSRTGCPQTQISIHLPLPQCWN